MHFSIYSQLFDCRNHIRVLQPMEGNRLYVCGTYAHNPKDYIIFVSVVLMELQFTSDSDTLKKLSTNNKKNPFKGKSTHTSRAKKRDKSIFNQ